MKTALVAIAMLSSQFSHALYMECKSPEVNAIVVPQSAGAPCNANLSVVYQGKTFCVSNKSKALNSLRIGESVQTCTEFTTDETGRRLARINWALDSTLEMAPMPKN